MIRAKHAKQIRRGIQIARTHLNVKAIFEDRARKGSGFARRELVRMQINRTDPKYLRSGESNHPKLVKKAFDEYVKRHK